MSTKMRMRADMKARRFDGMGNVRLQVIARAGIGRRERIDQSLKLNSLDFLNRPSDSQSGMDIPTVV